MAVIKNKSITFSLILVCLMVNMAPMAKAQLGGLGGGLGGLGNLLNIVNVQGVLMCSLNGTVSGNNATSVPPFPNAGVQLRCNGQNVSSTTTGTNGLFSLPIPNGLPIPLASLLNDCKIVVTTPLATCNSSLPAIGNLTSPLELVGGIFGSLFNIFNFIPALFGLVN